ncbi:MAG: tyrosine-type recombinase/integrase [Cyclobacteriaceae bacterium]
MKHLELQSQEFIDLREGFRQYLETLGYAAPTVYNLPNALNEVFYHLEKNNVTSLVGIGDYDLDNFWKELQQRPNERRGGGLSIGYLKKFDQAVTAFAKYLLSVKGINLVYHFDLPVKEDVRDIVYLTQDEIKTIYDEIDTTTTGTRDRAIMAVFYGCGLRRSEGVLLDLKDIQLEANRIHVRHGKGNKERLVPMAARVGQDIREYLIQRSKLLKSKREPALFLNSRGKRLSGQMMYMRLKYLVSQTSITKRVGLHTLRHSIATHLLQNGMSLEKIGKFLGHSSLESTQIYTHLIDGEV